MTRLILCVSVAVLAAACGPALAADKTDEAVVKVLQTPKQGAAVLHAAPPIGTGINDLAIPNDLDPVLADTLKNATPGSFLDVQTKMVNGKATLVSAAAYTARPGEDEPNVYAIVKRTTYRYLGADVPALSVTKFKKPSQLVLAASKDKDGNVTPNPDMRRTLDSLKDTDSVEVQTQTTSLKPGVFILKSLKVYVPWERAQFSKLTKKTFQGDDYTALEVLTNGDTLQMLMNAKDEGILMGVLNKIKHGEDLLYRSKAVDDVTWVTEVKPAVAKTSDQTTETGGGGGPPHGHHHR